MADLDVARTARASRSSAISNLTVSLMSRYAGRGATKVHTYFNDDMITVVLRDILTRGEVSLIENGREQLVLETRHAFQQLMSAELTAGIEEIVERTVIAFLSANHVDPDIAIETFILAPREDEQASDKA